jgi:hypothetical protein
VIFRRSWRILLIAPVAYKSSAAADQRRRLLTFGVGGDVFLLEVDPGGYVIRGFK